MIKTIFFDFDGVILESVQAKTDAFFEMYLPYGVDFAERVKLFHENNGGVSRFDKFRVWHKEWLGEDISEERIQDLAATFSKLSLEKVNSSPFVKGAKEFLSNNASDFYCYVLTGSAQSDIDVTIEALRLGSYFKAVYGSPRSKTDWGREIIERKGLKPNEIVFIGDASSDMKAARELGTHFILRATEINYDLQEKVEWLIPDLVSLPQIIEKLNN